MVVLGGGGALMSEVPLCREGDGAGDALVVLSVQCLLFIIQC